MEINYERSLMVILANRKELLPMQQVTTKWEEPDYPKALAIK